MDVAVTTTGVGSVIEIDPVPVHPLASVTVTPYGLPAANNPVSVAAIPPVLQAYVNGATPPLTEAVADPKSPGHKGIVCVTVTST